jgi:N-acetylglucosaminyl-diphospho-decaprenol L-rhamnosyltransferase
MAEVAIIVVSWNTRELTASCLESVRRTSGAVEAELLVVDNGSSDGSQAMVRERFPWVRLIANAENLGFARANNQAMRATESEFVLLLNSDAELLPGALESLLACLRAHPEAAAAGAKLLNPDRSFQASYAAFPNLLSELLLLARLAPAVYGPYFPSVGPEASREESRADWVGGACMMVRRAALDEVGLMDERYFMYSEEMDWCYTMGKAGWEIRFCPEAQVIHHGGQSANQVSERKLAMIYRSKLRFFRRHYGPAQVAVLRLMMLASSLVKMAVAALRFVARPSSQAATARHIRSQWNALWLAE